MRRRPRPEVGAFDDLELVRVDRRAAEVADLTAAGARRREAVEVAHVRVGRLRLGPKVGLPERDAHHAGHRRDRERVLDAERRLDEASGERLGDRALATAV